MNMRYFLICRIPTESVLLRAKTGVFAGERKEEEIIKTFSNLGVCK